MKSIGIKKNKQSVLKNYLNLEKLKKDLERRRREECLEEFVEKSIKPFREKFSRPPKKWYYDEQDMFLDMLRGLLIDPPDKKKYRNRLARWKDKSFNYQEWIIGKSMETRTRKVETPEKLLKKILNYEKPRVNHLGNQVKNPRLPVRAEIKTLGNRVLRLE